MNLQLLTNWNNQQLDSTYQLKAFTYVLNRSLGSTHLWSVFDCFPQESKIYLNNKLDIEPLIQPRIFIDNEEVRLCCFTRNNMILLQQSRYHDNSRNLIIGTKITYFEMVPDMKRRLTLYLDDQGRTHSKDGYALSYVKREGELTEHYRCRETKEQIWVDGCERRDMGPYSLDVANRLTI